VPAPYGAVFSCAERSFSGYRIPHGAFATVPFSGVSSAEGQAAQGHETQDTTLRDPLADEADWLTAGGTKPDRLHPSQKKGFASWQAMNAKKDFSYLYDAYSGGVPPLSGRIADRMMNQDGLRVTATDLNAFAACGARWFLGKLLDIKEEAYDAELMNERNLGIVYHDVLLKVYEKIRETDGVFLAKNVELYGKWAGEFAATAARDHDEFAGPLVEPLMDTLTGRITDGVCRMLECDAERLADFEPVFLEGGLSFAKDGLSYYGRIDRISRNRALGTAVLIDYKSGYVPPLKDYRVDDAGKVRDFQIPMYALLAENADKSPCAGKPLEFAWFGDIKKGKYQPIINDSSQISHGRTKSLTREEFEPVMRSLGEMARLYETSVRAENFTRPKDLPWTECVSCAFRKICRYVYSVRP